MKSYLVTQIEETAYTVRVKAVDKNDAEEIANDLIAENAHSVTIQTLEGTTIIKEVAA